MTYSSEEKQKLTRALRYWLATFVVVAGFMYYHSSAPLGPILLAGAGTLALTVYRARKP